MAICMNLMFARLGGVVGSNVASSLLENHCQVLFGLTSSLLIGERFKAIKTISILYSVLCAVQSLHKNSNAIYLYHL